ncbi:MAG: hypothetical protein ABUK01_18545 [Leptospirales bacterium]
MKKKLQQKSFIQIILIFTFIITPGILYTAEQETPRQYESTMIHQFQEEGESLYREEAMLGLGETDLSYGLAFYRNSNIFLNINGKLSQPFSSVQRLRFSKEMNSWAVITKRGSKYYIVTSTGKQYGPHNTAFDLKVSDNGSRFVFLQYADKGYYFNVSDGTRLGPFDSYPYTKLTSDNWSVYSVAGNEKFITLGSGEHFGPFPKASYPEILLAEKGSSYVLLYYKDSMAYLDDGVQTRGPFLSVKNLSISPNGKYWSANITKREPVTKALVKKLFVNTVGEIDTANDVNIVKYSKNSWGYFEKKMGVLAFVTPDGKKQMLPQCSKYFNFTLADSGKFSFACLKGKSAQGEDIEEFSVFVKGKEFGPYKYERYAKIWFDENGVHWAAPWYSKYGKFQGLLIDGVGVPDAKYPLYSIAAADGFYWIDIRDRAVYRNFYRYR